MYKGRTDHEERWIYVIRIFSCLLHSSFWGVPWVRIVPRQAQFVEHLFRIQDLS